MALTPNLGLELFEPLGVGWREDATAGAILDFNMMLIDAATASGGAVASVNGQVGVVVLTASSVGADASGAAAAAQTAAENFATNADTTVLSSAETFATSAVATETSRAETAEGLLVPKTTTVNGHALSSSVTVSASDLTTGTLPHGQLPTLVSGDIPNNAANTSGTAANLSGTPALPNGTTAATQPPIDNSTLIATDAFVQTAVELSMATVPLSITGGTYSFASLGVNALVNYTATAGAITAITIWIPFVGSGYAIGDVVTPAGGNYDAMILVTAISGAGAPTAGTILYGGTGYTSGTSKAAGVAISVPYTWLLSGTLTSNATFIMTPGTYLTQSNQWIFCNNTTGAFTVTVGVAAPGTDAPSGGRTVVIPRGANNSRSVLVQTDGRLNTDLCGIINGADLTVGALPNGTTATTQTALSADTKLATDAYCDSAVAVETSRAETAEALLAPLASPTFTGTVTLPSGQISSGSGTTVSKSFAVNYGGTPVVVVTPTTNAGAFYLSAVSSSGFTVTYATSGAQTFNYIVVGNPN